VKLNLDQGVSKEKVKGKVEGTPWKEVELGIVGASPQVWTADFFHLRGE